MTTSAELKFSIPLKDVLFVILAAAFVVSTAHAANPDKEFGAETIEPIEKVKPLPVHLVEEQVPSAAPQSAPTSDPKLQPPNTTGKKSPAKKKGEDDDTAENADEDDSTAGSDLDDPELSEETTTLLNVKDIDIAALVKSFSKLTKRNYIVDSNVKGKVTIHLPTPVSVAEALRIMDSVLLLKGFTTVPVDHNVWKVVTAKDAKQTTIPTIDGNVESPSDALVTQLARLKYVAAADMQQALSQFVSRDGLISPFTGTNSLILIDSAANIERMMEIVKRLDVPALDQDITIVPIQHAEAKDIAEKINQILGEKENDSSAASGLGRNVPRPVAPPPVPGSPPQPQMAQSGGDGRRALPMKVIADERTNSVIVVADEGTTSKVRAIIEELDSPFDKSGGRFWVYRLKHADAEELAGVLSSVITGNSSGSSGSSGDERRGALSGSSQSRTGRNSSGRNNSRFGRSSGGSDFGGGRERDSGTSPGRSTAGGGAFSTGGDQQGQGRVNFEGEVTVAPDPATNSLIINALRNDYMKLKQVVEELDIKRKQVLVEATILEVSLSTDEGLGIELQGTAANNDGGIIGQTNFGGLTNLLTNPARLTDLTLAAASTGSLTLPGGITIPSQAVLISAVSKHQNVNVLSSPTVLTTDNQEAEIIVGENVPFVTGTGTNDTNLSNTFNSIERQDVGITLRITPQIGIGDFVALKIFVEISNVVEDSRNNANGPTTTIRTTETNVEVKSNQMIVTGGLIQDSLTDSKQGVPFWQEIPVLGNFFRRDDERQRRTNLLVFITPKIVSDQYDAREATRDKSDEIEKVIREQDIEPNRREVLRNDKMDQVTETLPLSEGGPSTITPPRAPIDAKAEAALQRTEEALRNLAGDIERNPAPAVKEESVIPVTPETTSQPKDAPSNSSDDVLELSVTPKLPGDSAAARAPRLELVPESPRPRLTPPTRPNTTFVVMKSLQPNAEGIPFELGGKEQDLVGILLPGSSGSIAGRFFAVGGRYSYKVPGKGRIQFICIGKFSSEEEAKKFQPALSASESWYELTPQELLSLGKDTWYKM